MRRENPGCEVPTRREFERRRVDETYGDPSRSRYRGCC
jgi:uncharacterized short protein YbdD (DUF466 family)